MQKITIILAVLLSSFLMTAAELVDVSPSDILFLAHFDQNIKPEKGNTKGSSVNAMLTSKNSGFPFKGAVRNEALDLRRYPRYAVFPAEKNLLPAQGTLQMWICRSWNDNSYGHCVFFQTIPSFDKRNTHNWRNDLFIQKVPKKQLFSSGQGGKRVPFAYAPGKGKWIHLSLTWDAAKKEKSFYINGELKDKRKMRNVTELESFALGGPKTFNAQSLVDEVRILKRVLTPEEIKQDYQAQLEGKRFTLPTLAAAEEKLFVPRKIAAPKGGVIIDAEERFQVPATATDFKVDGNLNKKVWKETPAFPYVFKERSGKPLKNKNIIKARYSPTALYFGMSFYQDMSKIIARYDQNDMPIYNDDSIEIFLDTPGEKGGFHQLIFNSLGNYFDAKDNKKTFNVRNMQVKTKRFKDHWDLEVKIPFASLNFPRPFAGDRIGLRFCRSIRGVDSEYGALPKLIVSGNNRRTRMGGLCFVPGIGSNAIEITSPTADFQLGINNIPFQVKNNGKKAFKGSVKLLTQDNQGNVAEITSKPVTVPAGKQIKLSFEAKCTGFDILKFIVTANTPKHEVASLVLPAGFPAPPVTLKQMQEKILTYQSSLASLLKLDHPVYRGAAKNLAFMKQETDKFAGKLSSALKAGKSVPSADVKKFAELVAGFEHYTASRRYLLWQTSPWETGTPNALPEADYTRDLNLNFSVAGNEREAVCFIISGLFCGNRLDLRALVQSISQRRNRDNFISTDNFEIYIEKFVNHSGDIITAPLVRTPGNYITVTPGEAVRVWVILNTAGLRIKPGTYRTSLLLKHAYDTSVATRAIPVQVKKWNFKLPETHEWPLKSFFWGANYFMYDEIAMLRLTHSYHITHGATKSSNYTHGLENDRLRKPIGKGLKFREDLVKTANEEFFREAKKLKMCFVFHWSVPSSLRWLQLMAERMDKMGFKPEQYVFKALIRDEFIKKHIPQYAELRKQVAEYSKNKWHFQAVYLSTPPPVGATIDDLEEAKLPEFYKMWTVIRGLTRDTKRGAEVIRRLKAKGCQVWSYNCARYMQIQSVLNYYRLYPWECYMQGLDGVAIWTSMSPGGDDGFDHSDGYDDGALYRGLDKKPITTKRMEAFREGLEDVAYMDILKKELAKAAAKGKKYPAFEKLLNDRKNIMKMSDQQMVDEWRLAVGEAIDKLRK